MLGNNDNSLAIPISSINQKLCCNIFSVFFFSNLMSQYEVRSKKFPRMLMKAVFPCLYNSGAKTKGIFSKKHRIHLARSSVFFPYLKQCIAATVEALYLKTFGNLSSQNVFFKRHVFML